MSLPSILDMRIREEKYSERTLDKLDRDFIILRGTSHFHGKANYGEPGR